MGQSAPFVLQELIDSLDDCNKDKERLCLSLESNNWCVWLVSRFCVSSDVDG